MANDRNRFKSARDLWLMLLLWATITCTCIMTVIGTLSENDGQALAITVCILSSILILSIMYGTYYWIDGDTLCVRSGPLTWKVAIANITAIEDSGSALSSPAMSMDRMKILSNKHALIISPERREEFIALLLSINPSIAVDANLLNHSEPVTTPTA